MFMIMSSVQHTTPIHVCSLALWENSKGWRSGWTCVCLGRAYHLTIRAFSNNVKSIYMNFGSKLKILVIHEIAVSNRILPFFHSFSLSKVAWVRVDTQTILSIHHNVITQNPRISLSYTDQRTWYLHIKDVQEIDRGWYMCQVNTDPMRSRQGYLQVVGKSE